ncbi:AMP-binding protein [Tomitella biformata]|uniref:AMP-binding protein n=1 Tax=Tomitella biformata TaxID=630403 RepID=UPI0004B28B42|nr:AMP-binding protein [Tomitella biformata]
MAQTDRRELTPDWWADREPDRLAVVVPGGASITYGDLAWKSRALAQDWIGRGIEAGDRVAIVMENCADYLVVAIAALRAGVRLVAVNIHLTAAEAVHVVVDSDARLVVVGEAFVDVAVAAQAGAARPPAIVVAGGVSEATGVPGLYDSLADPGPADASATRQGTFMFYSSGTTGKPKGILRAVPDVSFAQGDSLTEVFSKIWGFDSDSVWLNSAPLYHAYPLQSCTSVIRWGGTLVLTGKFDAEESLRLIDRHGVTHSSMVPTMFVRFLRLPAQTRARYDVSSLKTVLHAGAPCSQPVKQAIMDWWGPVLYEFYGGSENIGMVLIGPQDWLAHPGSVGKPAPGTISVLDGEGLPTGPNERGTIWFDAAPQFSYHHAPEKSAEVFDAEGRATLGDLGYLDADGYLYLDGRRTDLIISGGVNIYPAETEQRLAEHPAVFDVAVIGVPDDEYGQQVKAVVQLEGGHVSGPEMAETLIAYCREQLAAYKCPRSVSFEESLPRTPTGKLLKRVLMDREW